MDFMKLKSINWVGNIYQKFETICQEVDGIVNQDTIKYVENQVQTVGKSVKKISNAVQDLLPPVKHDANGVAETQKSAISAKSRKKVTQNSLDVTSKQSPTEPNVKDPVRDQLSPVSTEYDLTDQPSLPTMNTLEVAESDLSVGKIDKVLATEKSIVAIEKQSPTEPNVMNPVTNQPSLVSSKYHLADQLSSPTLIDTVKVPESDSSVGKVDEVLTSEGSVDVTENQLPTKLNAMDPVTNQLSVVSGEYYLPDQPSSPISVDTLKVPESNLSVGNIDGDLDIENSLDSPEKQSPMEPNLMDHVTKQLSLVGSKYYLADQPSSSAVDTLEVLESELSVENIDEVLANENSLDATENLTRTDPNVIDPCQPSLVSSKDNLAGQLSSPASMNTLEVVESDLSVPEIDDIFTNEDSAANNEETAVKVSAPILEELTSPFVAEHSTASPHGVFSHSNHENRCADLPEVAPVTPAYGLEFESEQKSTVCNESSDETEDVSGASSTTSEIASSVVSGENAIENMELASFSSSNAKDSNGLPSSASPSTVSGENKDLGMGLSSSSSVISPESVAEGTSRTAEIMPLTVPFRKQQVQICDSVQYGALRLSLDIGCSDESSSDSSHFPMETIDLHDKVMLEERNVGFHNKVKLEESCVIIDDSVLHAVSSRARKLRSCKKRIQDAFTSNKRLAKEYEQLAIWFGDSDIDSSHSQGALSNMEKSEIDDACDFGWELL
ncbi:chitinase-like protein PB1E7.04c [Pyrus communis]|uniref:chitinase-like protein PB1E7.04c n=1 Tax=Pyrus communis TaxID=23211 RepID=UPI0035C15206